MTAPSTMRLSIENDRLIMRGTMRVGRAEGPQGEVSIPFDEVQEAIDFASENEIDITGDPIVTGFNIGSLAVAVSESRMDEAQVHAGLVFSTDSAWTDALRKLAQIINNAADDLEHGTPGQAGPKQ